MAASGSAAKGKGGDPGEIDISSLSVEQLQTLMKQVEQELTGLKQSYGALKSAEQRFRTSREAVAGLKTTPDGEEVLVPLTTSLFVPGRIKATSRVLVDVGTGFYVGKSLDDASAILEKKEKSIVETTNSIARQVREKEAGAEAISQMMYMKGQAARAAAAGRTA
ncbi:hypothetical protein FNF27_06261 [Cafeteria roenbergensis]|uniref:Prefoldin subunit 5 n=1 Tax=Cafeteria roenbergensis TaxID=33653 RepID=A0A5A8CA02_CAFRO|nr:hypothetical protein FNF28_07547 [Cafeteria roenbergensis]KAA0149943.1 hypothetical protein FNF29_05563 [Cafeteria roenbergensis]KAA0157984.1 hypothetical protein FNF31_05623 [Cafeteria roenbergensis]KAA0171754.1 hypothetical protein FNF27_06261 [Cafeteria roenbergensis]|eukprot:KAA0149943.1 hypothetical protein FNF29_05563 [Cafeteria roenbergensis]